MQELTIKLFIDDSQSKRAQAAQVAAFRKAEDAAAKMARAQEAAFKRAAEASAKAAQRGLAAAQKAAKDAAEAYARMEDKALDAANKAAITKSRVAQKAAQDAIRNSQKRLEAEERSAQRSVQAEADRVAKLQALGRQQLSRDEVILRARAQANQKFQHQRVNDAAKAMASTKGSSAALEELLGMGARFTPAFVGVSAVTATFAGLRNELVRNRETAIKYSESLLDTKNDLKEIATLKGFAFADDKVVKQVTDFSKATGLTITQSDDFQRQLFGSSAGGLQKGNINQETLEKAAVITGRAAARQTKDVSTRGDVVGLLTQLHDYQHDKAGKLVDSDTAAKAIARDTEAVRLGLTEGRGDDAPLSKSFANVAGSLAGDGMPVPDAPKLASLIGVMSLSAGPGMADTRADQYVRGLRGETPQQMEFMKQFTGRTEHDDLETQADKFHVAMAKVKKSGRDATEFLVESGVPSEQRKALVEGDRNYDILKKRFRTSENPANGANLEAENEAFKASPAGRKAFGEAELKSAELEKGKDRENLTAEMPAAKAELVREGMGTDWSYGPGNFARWVGSGFTVEGEQSRIEERAAERLRQKSGSPDTSGMESLMNFSTLGLWGGARSATDGYNQDANKYQKKIDDDKAKNDAKLVVVLDKLDKKLDAIPAAAKIAPPQAPPTLLAQPPGGMQRPNGG